MLATCQHTLKHCVPFVLSINKLKVTYTLKWNTNGLISFQSGYYLMDVTSDRQVSSAMPLVFVLGLCHGDGNVPQARERAGHLRSFYHLGI